MTTISKQLGRLTGVLLLGLATLALPLGQAQAAHDIRGIYPIITGTDATFNLYAFPFNINLPEGTSLHMWGFGDVDAGANATHAAGDGYGLPQYPGPTLVVTEGDTVTINLLNSGIPQPVSIVVTGHDVASNCVTHVDGDCNGLVTEAAEVEEEVSYTFIAGKPGTYIYHSLDGSNPGLHVEMGLLGVLVVRPADLVDTVSGKPTAYGDGSGTEYDQEFLSLLTEIDPDIHLQVERGHINHFTNSDRFAKVWFINGRVFPDLFQGDYNSLFPHQPYESLALAHPRDRVLVRQVNAGQDSHPFHFHGENLRFIARDGRMLSSNGTVADIGRSDNTINSAPKQTIDAIWEWSGAQLGWDIYGHDTNHTCEDTDGDGFGDGINTTYEGEWCDDHGKPFPVDLPGVADLALGGWWSGSPFLGDTGGLPPGEGGLNPNGGYFFVWHSHAEKELTTFDIFPGGSLGAVVVLPPGTPIE